MINLLTATLWKAWKRRQMIRNQLTWPALTSKVQTRPIEKSTRGLESRVLFKSLILTFVFTKKILVRSKAQWQRMSPRRNPNRIYWKMKFHSFARSKKIFKKKKKSEKSQMRSRKSELREGIVECRKPLVTWSAINLNLIRNEMKKSRGVKNVFYLNCYF